jgi:hypothetical protein
MFRIPCGIKTSESEIYDCVQLTCNLWVVTKRSLIGGYQRIGVTYCLCLQGIKWRRYIPPKLWKPRTRLHGVTAQKKVIQIFTAF